jgi:hypothetical protein
VAAVLEALGKRAGPEDLRSKWQRDHDALEEACLRLIASIMAAWGLARVGGNRSEAASAWLGRLDRP